MQTGELFWKNTELTDLPGEIWVDAYGYDGIYSVSNLGRVRSEDRRVPTAKGDRRVRMRILSQAKSKDNRLSVGLSLNNIKETKPLNQLIYYSFNVDKINDLENGEVYHTNKIDFDNRLFNLDYNSVKGESYKISIELGNVTHLDKARKELHKYTKETAIIKNGMVVKRKCIDCGELKEQNKFKGSGCNLCNQCKYDRKLKRDGKKRRYNTIIIITDIVTKEEYISTNKNKCIISKHSVNRYANTGEIL